ncbi:hypothetical protein B0H16DRAFT_1796643 [Mycena metata]|uniref:Uncharacterized protein n=1 Tax=Mycena metata TaxID=1033252 RepID=A0AAD7JI26_9AGAR|nr:hypothetical protein B0H16DRAFT_1796643 [Mycena metata]
MKHPIAFAMSISRPERRRLLSRKSSEKGERIDFDIGTNPCCGLPVLRSAQRSVERREDFAITDGDRDRRSTCGDATRGFVSFFHHNSTPVLLSSLGRLFLLQRSAARQTHQRREPSEAPAEKRDVSERRFTGAYESFQLHRYEEEGSSASARTHLMHQCQIIGAFKQSLTLRPMINAMEILHHDEQTEIEHLRLRTLGLPVITTSTSFWALLADLRRRPLRSASRHIRTKISKRGRRHPIHGPYEEKSFVKVGYFPKHVPSRSQPVSSI